MDDPESETHAFPGLLGLIECNHAGEIVRIQGDEAEALSQVLVFFHQMADLVGESFGMEGLEAGHIIGKQMTAVCVPGEHTDFGFLFESKAKINELLPQLLQG